MLPFFFGNFCSTVFGPIYFSQVLKIWRTRFKELNHTSIEKDCEQIKRCIEMGLSCVETDASERPTTREIIESLEGCGSSILHVSNGKRSATDKLDHNFWKESDPTFDHRKVVQVSNILETQEVTEEGKPSPRDRLVVEILEQPERRDLILGEAFFAVEGDILRGRLIYLENRGNIQFSEYVVLLLFSERTAGVVTCK